MYSTGHIDKKEVNDQPKPATGERDYLDPNRVDKVYPKTTAGEWTAAIVRGLLYEDLSEETGVSNVVDAHNAALADKDEFAANWKLTIESVHQRELAAEREKVQPLVDALSEFATQLDWVLQHAHNINGEARENLASIRDAVLAKVKEGK